MLPRGYLTDCHLGRGWIGQDRGIFTQVLYARRCSPWGAFCEWVKANPFQVTRRKISALCARHKYWGGGVEVTVTVAASEGGGGCHRASGGICGGGWGDHCPQSTLAVHVQHLLLWTIMAKVSAIILGALLGWVVGLLVAPTFVATATSDSLYLSPTMSPTMASNAGCLSVGVSAKGGALVRWARTRHLF